MNSIPMHKLVKLLGVWCCCGMLAACHREAEPVATPSTAPTKTKSVVKSEKDPLAGMVMAVAADARHQPFELRFELSGRPEIGQAVDVKLNLLAVDDATDVKLSVSTAPKMVLVTGAEASYAALKAGEAISHTITLRSTETGIFVADVKITGTANGGPRTAIYAIPIAVVPAASAAADATAKATVGQAK